jgi:hypothetical protein
MILLRTDPLLGKDLKKKEQPLLCNGMVNTPLQQ